MANLEIGLIKKKRDIQKKQHFEHWQLRASRVAAGGGERAEGESIQAARQDIRER